MKLSRQELFLNRLQNKVAIVTGACRFMLLPVDVTDEKGWVDVLRQGLQDYLPRWRNWKAQLNTIPMMAEIHVAGVCVAAVADNNAVITGFAGDTTGSHSNE